MPDRKEAIETMRGMAGAYRQLAEACDKAAAMLEADEIKPVVKYRDLDKK